MAEMRFQWRDKIVSVPTCFTEAQAREAAAGWPDGLIGLAEMLEAPRSRVPLALRVDIARRVLEALGEKLAPLALAHSAAELEACAQSICACEHGEAPSAETVAAARKRLPSLKLEIKQ